MTKCLRSVTQLLPRARDLFREHVQMVAKAQHILKHTDCLFEILVLVCTSLKVVSMLLFNGKQLRNSYSR